MLFVLLAALFILMIKNNPGKPRLILFMMLKVDGKTSNIQINAEV